jgi:hypothetical protein
MRVPSNIIIENKYTLGKELIYAKTYEEYQGYYYEINDKLFAGREFDPKALQLIRINSADVNPLRFNPKTATYGNLTKTTLPNNRIISIPFIATESGIKYLAKQLNSSPIRIFFVNKETFEREKSNALYSFTSLNYEAEFGFDITDLNKEEIPEIDIFLAEYSNQDSNDEFN